MSNNDEAKLDVAELLKMAASGVGRNHTLYCAAMIDNVAIVKQMIDAGANVRVNDDAPLHLAVRNGSAEMIELLLEEGGYSDEKLKWVLSKKEFMKFERCVLSAARKKIRVTGEEDDGIGL